MSILDRISNVFAPKNQDEPMASAETEATSNPDVVTPESPTTDGESDASAEMPASPTGETGEKKE